jgi:ATP-dependent helicase/nuclease subunit B
VARVRFILGRAGTGKSHHCVHCIVDSARKNPLGPPIFYLLPKQATFTAERLLTAELGAFTRVRVLSLETLGHEILTECGGLSVPEITPIGRQVLIGHLLRKHQDQLRFFHSSARQVGLAAEIDRTFAEFERAGQSPADLRELQQSLAETTDGESDLLASKLADLRLLYEQYTAYLGQDRLDPHRRLQQILIAIDGCTLFKDADVSIDAFYDFTDFERKLIAGVAKACRSMQIAITLDPDSPTLNDPDKFPDELSPLHRTETTHHRLWRELRNQSVEIVDPLILRDIHRFASSDLRAIEQTFAGKPVAARADAPAIRMIEAPDRRAEVDAAAREIRELLREDATLRLRDVVVLARDLTDYHELIEAAFSEHSLPSFADRRRPASHHPIIQLARCALQIARGDWPLEPVLCIAKTGIAAVSPSEADLLENYVLTHRIRGAAWSSDWSFRRKLTRAEDAGDLQIELDQINASRAKLIDPLSQFIAAVAAPQTIREFVKSLVALYESYNVRKTLGEWMTQAVAAEEFERREEHEQVWANFIDLLDQLVDLLGDQTVSLCDFQDILESGLEKFDLAITPPTVDQILIGQLDRTRTFGARVAVVLGLSEGIFPRTPRDVTIFSDRERKNLRDNKLELDAAADRKLLDENFLAYIGFTRASEKLIVTRPASDDSGRPLGASVYWNHIHTLFAKVQLDQIPREHATPIRCLSTPRQAIIALMRWARDPDAYPEPAYPALYQWLATQACCGDAIDIMRFRAWRALSYRNEASLSPGIAAQLFPSPLRATVSRIETFAACSFKHFLQYGLRLESRDDADLTPADMGRAYHHVLEGIVGDMLRRKIDFASLKPAEVTAMIRHYTRDIAAKLKDELLLSSARNQYLLSRIEKSLAEFIQSQRVLTSQGALRPAASGISFGSASQLPPYSIQTPLGRSLEIEGKIDRLDLVEAGAVAAVIDYRTGSDKLDLERVYHGLRLQLVTYLLVLQSQGTALAGRPITPSAAFYLRLIRKLETATHPDDAPGPDDPGFYKEMRPRGIFAASTLPALDESGELKASAAISARDITDDASFAALLIHVEQTLATLGDELLDGDISIEPYRLGQQSPCPSCAFRAVCRFDPGINRYLPLAKMKSADVFAKLNSEAAHD